MNKYGSLQDTCTYPSTPTLKNHSFKENKSSIDDFGPITNITNINRNRRIYKIDERPRDLLHYSSPFPSFKNLLRTYIYGSFYHYYMDKEPKRILIRNHTLKGISFDRYFTLFSKSKNTEKYAAFPLGK